VVHENGGGVGAVRLCEQGGGDVQPRADRPCRVGAGDDGAVALDEECLPAGDARQHAVQHGAEFDGGVEHDADAADDRAAVARRAHGGVEHVSGPVAVVRRGRERRHMIILLAAQCEHAGQRGRVDGGLRGVAAGRHDGPGAVVHEQRRVDRVQAVDVAEHAPDARAALRQA
jgi:hypothetical protein